MFPLGSAASDETQPNLFHVKSLITKFLKKRQRYQVKAFALSAADIFIKKISVLGKLRTRREPTPTKKADWRKNWTKCGCGWCRARGGKKRCCRYLPLTSLKSADWGAVVQPGCWLGAEESSGESLPKKNWTREWREIVQGFRPGGVDPSLGLPPRGNGRWSPDPNFYATFGSFDTDRKIRSLLYIMTAYSLRPRVECYNSLYYFEFLERKI